MLKKLTTRKIYGLISCVTILALIVSYSLYQKHQMQEIVKRIEANGVVQYKSYPLVEKFPEWLKPTVEWFTGRQIYNVYVQDNIDCSFLKDITSIEHLSIWAESKDLSYLQNLHNLITLELITDVSNINFVKSLQKLESLNIQNSKVKNLSPLKELTNLKELNFSHTPVSDLTPLQNLLNLETLDMSYTKIKDLRPLTDLKNLKTIQFGDTPVTDIRPLQNLPNLRSIMIRSVNISDAELDEFIKAHPKCKIRHSIFDEEEL
jgi:hypothetical protein